MSTRPHYLEQTTDRDRSRGLLQSWLAEDANTPESESKYAEVDVTRPRAVDDVVDDILWNVNTSDPCHTREVRVLCAELVQAARYEMAEELDDR